MAASDDLIAFFSQKGHVPVWAWQRQVRELMSEGRRVDVRSGALDADAPPERRVACLQELGGPRDPAVVEALRDLLAHDRPWVVYLALEGMLSYSEPALDEVVRELHDDQRRVCDLWFEDRVSYMAARVVRPDAAWLGVRRGELHGKDRFMALRVLARLGEADALDALASEPDDGFGEVEALRAELGLA